MASIGKDSGGRKRVLFVAEDGSRKTLRLGKCSLRQAETFKIRLEALIAGRFAGIDDETARWIADLPDDLHRKLTAVGLVQPRTAARSVALGAFLDQYIGDRADVKPNTVLVYGRTRKHLLDYFGAEKPLQAITEGDADAWRVYLVNYGLAPNTINRTCGIARQYFRSAARRRLIAENPFTELKTAVGGNKAREYFLSRSDAEKVLDACPDTQWKLIFALARYGGLRTPSETLRLRWSDIDWEKNRMLVRSPKTAHHEGHESRLVPIFPELRPLLMQAFEEAEPGTEYVVTRYRKTGLNLRTQLLRIILRAGLKPWPKLWQNLRSTRQTELARDWPEYVVCAWMGNSRVIAREHYLQIVDAHFEQAAGGAAQNRAQYLHAPSCTEQQPIALHDPENADLPIGASACSPLQSGRMGGTGLISKPQLFRFTHKAVLDHSISQ